MTDVHLLKKAIEFALQPKNQWKDYPVELGVQEILTMPERDLKNLLKLSSMLLQYNENDEIASPIEHAMYRLIYKRVSEMEKEAKSGCGCGIG